MSWLLRVGSGDVWGKMSPVSLRKIYLPAEVEGAEPPTSQIGGWTAIPEPSRESTRKRPQKTVIRDGRILVFANQLIAEMAS